MKIRDWKSMLLLLTTRCSFSILFMINQLLNELVTRSNAYAQKVLNSSRSPEKEKCFKHLKIYNCHRHEAVSRISFTYGACFHANIQVLLVSGSIVSKLFKSVMTRDRFTSVMQFLNFGVAASQWRWPFRKDQVPHKPFKYYFRGNFHASLRNYC